MGIANVVCTSVINLTLKWWGYLQCMMKWVNNSLTGFGFIHNPPHNFFSQENGRRMNDLMDNVARVGEQRSLVINYYMLLSGSCHVSHPRVKAHFPSASSRRRRIARKRWGPDSMWLSLNKLRVKLWGERPQISWKTCIWAPYLGKCRA